MRTFLTAMLGAICLFCAPAAASELIVSGAASLANAFTEVKQAFEKANPDLKVHLNFAASNPLLKQIMEGAPVDVFASADQATMDKAVAAKVVKPASRKDFALNDLVVIVPKGSQKPATLTDLKKLNRIAIGDPASVPAGRYSKDSLQNAGLWDSLQDKFILASSVRQALDYVARGEADAGFVYATDARHLADKVDVAFIAAGHDPVTYPIVVVVTGNNPEAGQSFLDFVISPAGQAILAKYGFSKP